MALNGWRFTDTPKARREQMKMEEHTKKSAMKLAKSNYRIAEKKKKEAMKLACSEATEMKKWATQKASWGFKHPKR